MSGRQTDYFVSDLHLGMSDSDGSRETIRRFGLFVRAIGARARSLFIVGDYFDFYFAYRTVIPKQCVRGLAWLYDLADAGVELHYICGNHDAWADEFLTSELGVRLYERECRTRLWDRNVLLIHGDGVSERDRSYRRVRTILRHPINRFLYRWLHPDLGVRLANRWSNASKNRDRYYEKYVGDESFFPWLQGEFQNGTDAILMGHHHIPQMKTFESGKWYINLGDWIHHHTYATLDEQGWQLHAWTES